MRIAWLNSWPNLRLCAEKEFIARARRALDVLGWYSGEVVTSDEQIAFEPDVVLVTHEFSPKLATVPTLGLMWSPPEFFQNDPPRVQSILTYDGYLAAATSVRRYLHDLLFSTQKNAPVSNFNFLPSCYRTEFPERKAQDGARTLFYAGVGWDGSRHGKIFQELIGRAPTAFYGPAHAWKFAEKTYRGELAADGCAVVQAIQAAGAALCIHRKEHRDANIPSMRLFEAAAAGAAIITDQMPFAREHFGDAALYIDLDLPPADVARQIQAHMDWMQRHPAQAEEKARAAHAIFCEKFCLEKLFEPLPDFVRKVRASSLIDGPIAIVDDATMAAPVVEYIVRVGSRPLDMVERCLRGLARQTYPHIGLVLVQFAPVDGLDALLETYRGDFVSIKRVQAEAGVRSTAYWAGLRALTAPYFGNCDDDDSLAPNHVATLMAKLTADPKVGLAYSGTIVVEDDPGHYAKQPNFAGDLGKLIPERRFVRFFEPFDAKKLVRFENYVNSNAWIARTSLLDEHLLVDPEMHVAEDFLLILAFLCKTQFAFTWRATAQWHWRSTARDNSVFREFVHKEEFLRRFALRFKYAHWMGSAGTGSVPASIIQERVNRRQEKLHAALVGLKKTLVEPRLWRPRWRYLVNAAKQSGLKGMLLQFAEIGKRVAVL